MLGYQTRRPTAEAAMPPAIRIADVSYDTEEFHYRTPIKFGGVAVDRATVLNVRCVVRTADGRTATGAGSMPLSNVWAFPSRRLDYATTLWAMLTLAERVRQLTAGYAELGHPVDITHALEPDYLRAAAVLTAELQLPEPIPPLATLVVASPFDAALHDAFGKANGRNCYHTYGPDFLPRDLGHYLGADYRGKHLSQFVRTEPVPRLPLYHLVGALDPLTAADVAAPVGDGLPETLGEWIVFNGLTHLKVKLNGDDLGWDVDRVLSVERVAAEAQARRGVTVWHYSLDFNERCPNVSYLLEFLHRLRAGSAASFERVQYIEQPTKRDLKADRANTMHEASKLKPVVIDESLLDLESLLLAREMGYTGAALKACKGQTQSLLLAAAAQTMGLFLCVQDLTCPGASLIHSAGLAAHVPGVAAIEANSRQYVPAANRGWDDRFPRIFRVTDGTMRTGELTGVGLSAFPK
jgi:L-alanine-DL-glutamate epimerase-like enolase superfamily enzyme